MRLAYCIAATTWVLAACGSLAPAPAADVVTTEHRVSVRSTAPSMAGQDVQLYVRELAPARASGPAQVVVFVHGAGTPAEVSFDSRRRDHSWAAYLAQAGFDTFTVDMTGYGRSSRPAAMSDACNLSGEQQARFIPALIPAPCSPTALQPLTTMSSDWDDIAAVVDHVRRLRGVERVSLVGWSQGGPRWPATRRAIRARSTASWCWHPRMHALRPARRPTRCRRRPGP
jgi:pimeloyl-ACP methyl ester carboxylesterase